jgi:uncharacterized membrane protein
VSSDFYATSIAPFAPIIIKILIAGVVMIAIVVDLLGGVIFDFDVNTAYRNVFRKLDEMVAEMEELKG